MRILKAQHKVDKGKQSSSLTPAQKHLKSNFPPQESSFAAQPPKKRQHNYDKIITAAQNHSHALLKQYGQDVGLGFLQFENLAPSEEQVVDTFKVQA